MNDMSVKWAEKHPWRVAGRIIFQYYHIRFLEVRLACLRWFYGVES